jgi:hypothetical protein
MLSTTAFSQHLVIDIKDVLDLATYEDVFQKRITLHESKKTVFSHDIKSWTSFNHTNGYHINVSGSVQPVEDGVFYVSFEKTLFYKNKFLKKINQSKFILQSMSAPYNTQDHYWGAEGLILRQTNSMKIE